MMEPIVARLRWDADKSVDEGLRADLLEAVETIEILHKLIDDMDKAILRVKEVAYQEFKKGHAYIEMELSRQKAHNTVWRNA